MRLWSIWNVLSSFLYFVGATITWVIIAALVALVLPPVIAWTLTALVVYGIVLGIVSNVVRTRNERRSQQMDKELAVITGHRKPK